jgi:hypothetical protein
MQIRQIGFPGPCPFFGRGGGVLSSAQTSLPGSAARLEDNAVQVHDLSDLSHAFPPRLEHATRKWAVAAFTLSNGAIPGEDDYDGLHGPGF